MKGIRHAKIGHFLSAVLLLLSWNIFFSLPAQAESSALSLIHRIKEGGYVLYIRHAPTNPAETDQSPINLTDCSTQRNLSEEGKKVASLMGEVFKAHQIPIGTVLSSPFCRCMDTAKIAFNQAHVSEHLFFAASLSKEERAERSDMLIHLLATPPQKNNTILVSHNSNLKEAVNIWPKTEGVIHVFLPKGNKVFEHLGAIEPVHFSELIQAATQVK
jgi:phosphohistidine phosphatase SixA